MIKREVYVDNNGVAHPHLVHVYSDLGCRLYQIDTGRIYQNSLVDHVSKPHHYKEMIEDLGIIPEELQEEEPKEAEA